MKNPNERKKLLDKLFKRRELKISKELQTFSTLEVMILIGIVCMVCISSTALLTYQIFKGSKSEYEPANSEISTIAETYEYILDNYYGDINKKDLVDGAISGMLEKLDDQNSSFIEEESSSTFNITLEGIYKGVGLEITNKEDKIVVSGIIEDSPAEKTGLKVNDILKKVDQVDLKGVSTTDFVSYISSKKTDDFTLIVERDGKESTYSISKDNITLKSVKSEIIEQNNKKIGYMSINIFARNTYTQFKEHLTNLEKGNINSLIIDLRGNTGGHLTAVTDMLGLFLDSNKIIYQTENKSGTKKVYSSGKSNKEYKIIILVNGYTASASEIMTAALKEQLDAHIIGTKTYGKGTVQELQTLSDGSQYKFTTKKWLTPNGTWINGVGITPDEEVELDEEYSKNPNRANDNQLQKALEYLKK